MLERVPLICDLDDLLLNWPWFAEWSIGCVGILRDWVVDTVAALCEEGKTTLTIEALKEYALQPDQRVRLEMEVRAGERKVAAGKARSEQQLLELTSGNGAKPPAPTSNQTGNSGPQAVKAPDDTSNPPKARKIERAAHRDPVGTTAHEETTTKCVFSGGVTEISVRKMRDAGVLKVECPECLSMRGLTPQGETVQSPSHNPRKTRTPNREARWVKREQAWELAGR